MRRLHSAMVSSGVVEVLIRPPRSAYMIDNSQALAVVAILTMVIPGIIDPISFDLTALGGTTEFRLDAPW